MSIYNLWRGRRGLLDRHPPLYVLGDSSFESVSWSNTYTNNFSDMSGFIPKKNLTEPNQPQKTRALTYTEMMNGGQQKMDDVTHYQEIEIQQRKDVSERSVEHLEQSFKTKDDQIGGGSGI